MCPKQNSARPNVRLDLVMQLYGVHTLLEAVEHKLDRMAFNGIGEAERKRVAWLRGTLKAGETHVGKLSDALTGRPPKDRGHGDITCRIARSAPVVSPGRGQAG